MASSERTEWTEEYIGSAEGLPCTAQARRQRTAHVQPCRWDCPAPQKRAASSVDVDACVVDVTRNSKKRGALPVSTIRVTVTEGDATLQGVDNTIFHEAFNGHLVVLLNNKNLSSLIHRQPKVSY